MSRWLQALAVVAPRAAMRRAHALTTIRQFYDGATEGHRGSTLRARKGSANAALAPRLTELTARAHGFVRNTPEAARTIEVLASHIVGTGVHLSWQASSGARTKRVKNLWKRWCKVSDIEGVLNFAGQQRLSVAGMFEGGDTLTRLVDIPIPAAGERGYGLPPLRLQVLEGEMLDTGLSPGLMKAGDPRVRLGVETDEWNRRVAFHLLADPPGETALRGGRTVRIAAKDACHLFRPLRPGQLRGVTVFAPVFLTGRDHADLIEALTMKARMEACFGIGVETPDARLPPLASGQEPTVTRDGRGIEDLHPGMIARFAPGEKIVTVQPTGGLAAEPLLLANLMRFAAGVNLTYDQVSGDLRQANYSSLRAGKIEFFRFVEQFQWLNLVPMWLDRIAERWLDRALLAGLLTGSREDYSHDYVMPAREPIDPKKDLEADILAVRAGRLSPQEFIEAWGRDWREVVADTAAFLKEVDAQGLVFDIDPRRTTQTGAAQAARESKSNDDP